MMKLGARICLTQTLHPQILGKIEDPIFKEKWEKSLHAHMLKIKWQFVSDETIDKFYRHPSSFHQKCIIEAELASEMDISTLNSIPRLQSEQKYVRNQQQVALHSSCISLIRYTSPNLSSVQTPLI